MSIEPIIPHILHLLLNNKRAGLVLQHDSKELLSNICCPMNLRVGSLQNKSWQLLVQVKPVLPLVIYRVNFDEKLNMDFGNHFFSQKKPLPRKSK